MWKILDYGWLSDSARPVKLETPSQEWPYVPIQPSQPWNEAEKAAEPGSATTANPTSSIEENSYAMVEDFDLDKPLAMHDELPIDFMAYADELNDPWPDILDGRDAFFSADLGISSPWSNRPAT